jgi:prepilin-type N-terminal cleavage/methylation domain-containing protein
MSFLRHKMKSNQNGFTLVESMIALMVFTIGVLGMLSLQTTSTGTNTLSNRVQHNTNQAVSLTEELFAADYADARIDTPPSTFFNATEYSNDGKNTFDYRVVDNLAIPRAKLVTVTAYPANSVVNNGRAANTITIRCFKPFIRAE